MNRRGRLIWFGLLLVLAACGGLRPQAAPDSSPSPTRDTPEATGETDPSTPTGDAPKEGVRLTLRLDEALETLQPTAWDLWPDSFGGLWGDLTENGRRIRSVTIAFTEDAREKVAVLARGFPEPQLLRPATVAHSYRELQRRQKQMIADRELAHSGRLVLPGVPGGNYDLDIDIQRNALVVILEDASPQAVATFKERYGDDVIVQEGGLATFE